MTSPSGESKAFTFFRQLFFLGSIVLLTAGLGWNWGYHAKYRQGKSYSIGVFKNVMRIQRIVYVA